MAHPNLEEQLAQLKLENEELKKQLIQAQKMSSVGALAASITHEFNNILTTTINYAKMGLRHKDANTREKAFTKILNAGQRAAKITTGMLSYSRNQCQKMEATDVKRLVEEILVLVSKDLQNHRVNLDTRFEGQPFAELNANQIQQVILNLIVNGRQAMDGGGQMLVTVKENEDTNTAEIAVRDSGSGIPPEKMQDIFKPFFTTKEADAQGQGGTGLGLSLCREVIEAHRGRIRVESKQGEGTTFTLRFPRVPAPLKTTSPINRAG